MVLKVTHTCSYLFLNYALLLQTSRPQPQTIAEHNKQMEEINSILKTACTYILSLIFRHISQGPLLSCLISLSVTIFFQLQINVVPDDVSIKHICGKGGKTLNIYLRSC